MVELSGRPAVDRGREGRYLRSWISQSHVHERTAGLGGVSRGALVNDAFRGHYLDEPRYDELWTALGELSVPLYLDLARQSGCQGWRPVSAYMATAP
jgi:hypothetical protein